MSKSFIFSLFLPPKYQVSLKHNQKYPFALQRSCALKLLFFFKPFPFESNTRTIECRDKIFYSFGCRLEKYSVQCRLGIITRVSSIGVNFDVGGQVFFALNVGGRMKKISNVGCQNNPFHGP